MSVRSNRWLPGLLALLLAGGCSDDSDPAGTGNGGSGEGIQGVVARQKTGVGIPGVTISALAAGDPVAAAVTGPDGAFALPDLPDGVYHVVPVGLELAGLDPRFDVMEPLRDTVEVADGSSPELVFAVVGLIPARITGTLTCGGESQPGATVRVAGGTGTDETATTDPLGRYAVLDLLPGVYTVIPGAADCTLAPAYRIVAVRPGEFVQADFGG